MSNPKRAPLSDWQEWPPAPLSLEQATLRHVFWTVFTPCLSRWMNFHSHLLDDTPFIAFLPSFVSLLHVLTGVSKITPLPIKNYFDFHSCLRTSFWRTATHAWSWDWNVSSQRGFHLLIPTGSLERKLLAKCDTSRWKWKKKKERRSIREKDRRNRRVRGW